MVRIFKALKKAEQIDETYVSIIVEKQINDVPEW